MPGDLLPGPPTAGLLPRGLHASGIRLCAIAKRLWYKELERRKRNVPLEEEHLAGQAAPDDPAQETEQREGRLALYRAMQQLDPDTREVIHLRLAGDFSFRDMGTSWTGARYGPGSGSTGEKRSWLGSWEVTGMEHKLDCCVVRDLLPAYLEGLTEEETTRQVEAHLEECPECRRHREAMQASLPVVRAPKRALAFLKKVKRTRLIAAVLSAVVALLLIFLVYDSEYHWRGDLPSLTQGLQDYLGWTDHLEGCAIEALAATEVDGTLYVSFTSDSEDNVHGVAELDRGLNGKYQFVSASYSPFPYTGGVFLHSSEDLWLFAGVGCREIYGFTAQFEVYDSQGLDRVVPVTFPVQEDTFLLAVPKDQLDLGTGPDEHVRLPDSFLLLDQEGEDITQEYEDPEIDQSWGAGTGTAERFLLYVLIGLIGLIGFAFVRFFLL